MSQDIVADALNQMMNIIRARKKELVVKRYSKFLLSILALAKLHGYVESYTPNEEEKTLAIKLGKIHACGAIKPRFVVAKDEIEKYVHRFLPAKHIGMLVVSTSQGIMTHKTALEKGIGGCLVAYMY
ncbi:30S ribosomal protein S8 [Candidatus Pacearchaeota archaeon]|nr:MAG: 30S ribosomal protein S8 [Candidatus Pacearchaeota archaeon]